ncbi:hypothetical protein NBT05_10315 [Aquimarina sp. ERC-38]|uniref:DUF6913 domain-containing protein n=1 Tax=Aquimarina sp. ERC-38 TaxID=2949996 RepID=UPI002247E21E|nr:hypothetical protein [Aquimarina sp. ERC-38]UZO79363.1 hypothetical protein NBT05_10315 [Aquimarina sp. ERC-38]
MILKGFKQNALKRSIESYITKRKKEAFHKKGIDSLGVLIDASAPVNVVLLLKLANELGVPSEKLTVLGYQEDQKEITESPDSSYYNDKAIGVNGSFKSNTVNNFINQPFDVLINFYGESKPALDIVASASKARFKVGFAAIDHRINDLVIGGAEGDNNLFINELKKYLKILEII